MFKCYSFVLFIAFALGFVHCGSDAVAQEYLGVLSEAIKPEVAEKLELSDEQREKVLGLSRSRFAAAIGLGQQLREAPLSQQKIMLDSFANDSEKMLFDLLDEKQRQEMSEYRVEWLGMLALADANVAERLKLADWQQQLVGEWKDKVRAERRGREADKIRAEAERAIRQELSDSQWAEWQLLAGQVEANAVGEPTPPVREQPQETVIAEASPAASDEVVAAAADASDPSEVGIDEIRLVLNFQEQPWKDVIAWLATQADMSVQSDVVPPGTFTYRDKSRTYSVTETLDIMNAALLNVGYTLFRQDRMLRTIDFEVDQKLAGEVLKELADTVSVDELANRGKYEPIKMLFTLERLDPEIVKTEVEQLLSIQGTVVSLPSSGQLLVTDMAGNVRTIANYIKRAEDPKSSRGSSIQVVPLKNINAEEVLAVARPLLGLEDGSNVSDDLSISTNTFGTVIYAKGAADKLQNLRDLVMEMDTPPEQSEAVINIEVPYIDRHRVVGIDMQLAYEVVSQLLAGGPADIKLAPDESAKQLVLFARADDHKMVRDTLQKLAGESSGFEVIQLKHIDTQLAISFIKEFFEISDGADASGGKPIVNGDQVAKQVWVKGSESQIEQIRDQLAKLEENYKSNDILGDRVRLIPASGRQANDAIEQVQALWEQAYGKRSPIRFISPSSNSSGGLQQRTFAPTATGRAAARTERRDAGINGGNAPVTPSEEGDSPAATGEAVSVPAPAFEPGDSTTMQRPARGHFVAQEQGSASDETVVNATADNAEGLPASDEAPEIVIMQGPAGLIITSDDKEALAKFESLWRLVTSQSAMGADSPTVVYLTNIPAAAAKELLETTLSGSSSSSDSGGGLLGDMAGTMFGGMGGMMGALMGGGGGGGDLIGSSSGMASGDYSIVADPRLNALFIKANPSDMMLIEELLKVIDQVESPYVIETRGRFASIPVVSQDVTQVLNTIKTLYGDRIAGVSSGGGGGGGNQQPNPAELIAALRGGGRGGRGGGGGANSALTEPKISLAADTSTNMLLVFAQPSQIEDIEDIVAMMDAAGAELEEDVIVADIGAINSEVLKTGLPRILGAKVVANSSSSTTPSSSGQSSSSPSDDAAAAQRRAEFFQRMREGGTFGGRGGGTTGGGFPGFGGGTTGRGGTTGGFGGFGGGNTGRGGTTGGRGGQTGGRGGR